MAAARRADPALLLPAGCEGFSAAQWPLLCSWAALLVSYEFKCCSMLCC